MHSSVSYQQNNIFINSCIKSLLKAPGNPPRHLNFSSQQPSGPKNPLKRSQFSSRPVIPSNTSVCALFRIVQIESTVGRLAFDLLPHELNIRQNLHASHSVFQMSRRLMIVCCALLLSYSGSCCLLVGFLLFSCLLVSFFLLCCCCLRVIIGFFSMENFYLVLKCGPTQSYLLHS